MFYSVGEFDKFDTVVVNHALLDKIKARFKNSDEQVPFTGILTEGVIRHVDLDVGTMGYLYFKELGNMEGHIEFYIYNIKKRHMMHVFSTDLIYREGEEKYRNLKFGLLYASRETKEMRANRMEAIGINEAMYMGVFGYIHMLQQDKKTEMKYVEGGYHEPIPGKKSKEVFPKRNKVTINGITIVTNRTESDFMKTVSERHRYTESWTVRGHYRRYKSGKVIFIKAHTKGPGEGVKAKDYTIKEM